MNGQVLALMCYVLLTTQHLRTQIIKAQELKGLCLRDTVASTPNVYLSRRLNAKQILNG